MLLAHRLTLLLREEAERQGVEIDIFLRNIVVNNSPRGCSGHVINSDTGCCVYLDTEGLTMRVNGVEHECLYRFARDIRDYSSNSLRYGYNRWCADEELPEKTIGLLKTNPDISLRERKTIYEDF